MNKYTFIGLLLILILIPVSLTAQGTNELQMESAKTIQATDALGHTIVMNAYPKRIIAAGKSTLIVSDALYLFPEARNHVVGLGLTNQGMGDFYSYIAPEFLTTDRYAHSVSAEELASENPDLVLIKSRNYESLGTQLELLGIPVFTMNLENPETFTDEINQLSILLGEEQRAKDIEQFYAQALLEVERNAKSIETEDSTLLLYCSAKDGVTAFQSAPASWIQTYITETAGAQAIWKEANMGSGWKKINFEQIASWDPERIYLVSYKVPVSQFIDEIERSDAWQNLKAAKNSQIKAFPADFHNWAQPDTRWILGLQWLSQDLTGSSSDFTEKIKTFYTELYQITDEQTLKDIILRYEKSL